MHHMSYNINHIIYKYLVHHKLLLDIKITNINSYKINNLGNRIDIDYLIIQNMINNQQHIFNIFFEYNYAYSHYYILKHNLLFRDVNSNYKCTLNNYHYLYILHMSLYKIDKCFINSYNIYLSILVNIHYFTKLKVKYMSHN